MLTRSQQLIELSDRGSPVPGCCGIDYLPDRLRSTSLDHLAHILATYPSSRPNVNSQLFHLGREEPHLGPDELEQQPRGLDFEMALVLVRRHFREPGDKILLRWTRTIDSQSASLD